MYISSDTVQTVKSTISPVQAMEYYTTTTGKRGRYLCPFHNDRSPSVTVKGNHWHCWSCGANGDVIDFTSRYFGIGFRDAVAKLAGDFGVPIDDGNPVDPEQYIWAKVEREVERKNRAEYRKYLNDEIDKLTICHRVLLQHGASDEVLRHYADEIDDLIMALEGR